MILDRARFLGQVWIGVAAWPAIYQAWNYFPPPDRDEQVPARPLFGKFQRMPTDQELNDFLRRSDKTPDLGWMYTVVAGVLNILVIYDAFAGPAFRAVSPARDPAITEAAT
jgi:hypothetical protein